VAGLAPGDPVAPYWVTMGAASITVLGAAQSLQVIDVAGSAAVTGLRTGLTDLGLVFWSVATGLIPALSIIGAVRWRRGLTPRGFRREWWMIVFPAGMYATASMRIGTEAGGAASPRHRHRRRVDRRGHLDSGLCLDDRLDRRPPADRGLVA
jgi:Voltage-dependent anion channel